MAFSLRSLAVGAASRTAIERHRIKAKSHSENLKFLSTVTE